jgi:hypothetical protein
VTRTTKRLIIAAVLVIVVLGGAGTATYLLTRNHDKGQASPDAAVTGFLTAVYIDRNVTEAARYVCPTARDKGKLTSKINQIRDQNARYQSPVYSWSSLKTEQTRTNQAVLTTTVSLWTGEEQKATQALRVTATRANGWWVCEVNQTT